jgi:hypothetical protein
LAIFGIPGEVARSLSLADDMLAEACHGFPAIHHNIRTDAGPSGPAITNGTTARPARPSAESDSESRTWRMSAFA